MRFFEDIEIGQRRELGSFTFTAELIKKFAAQFDPQRFHLDEEAGRKSLFGGLAASGWHVGSVCMKLLVADGQRQAREAAGARRDGRGLGTVAGVSRPALDQAGAGRRHHQLCQRGRIAADVGVASANGASCRPATPAPTSAANWCSRCWRPHSCRDGTSTPSNRRCEPGQFHRPPRGTVYALTHSELVPVITRDGDRKRGRRYGRPQWPETGGFYLRNRDLGGDADHRDGGEGLCRRRLFAGDGDDGQPIVTRC